MICTTCLAIAYASPESREALIIHQARVIDRLTGGRDVKLEAVTETRRIEPKPVPASAVATVEAALATDNAYRKPPRVAAPHVVRSLVDAGYLLEESA